MHKTVTAQAPPRPPASRRALRPPYGVLVGPFVAGVSMTLLVLYGTRQEVTTTWVLTAILIGVVLASLAFASSLWRHEPHVVAARRARYAAHHASGATPEPPKHSGTEAVRPPSGAPGPAGGPESAESTPPGGAETHNERPRSRHRRRRADKQDAPADDPLGHIHAVEDQGRRLRRDCLNCGTPVPLAAAECPSCGHQQIYQCKGCQTQVRLEWTNCPECGRSLA